MKRALSEYVVTGIRTNLAFHQRVMSHPEFAAGRYDTGFIERHRDALIEPPCIEPERREAVAAAIAVAAARMEVAAVHSSALERVPPTGPTLSPWVAHHRARRSAR
jgi:acetyl-CoA carboxylase biotin carboxylase subunit